MLLLCCFLLSSFCCGVLLAKLGCLLQSVLPILLLIGPSNVESCDYGILHNLMHQLTHYLVYRILFCTVSVCFHATVNLGALFSTIVIGNK